MRLGILDSLRKRVRENREWREKKAFALAKVKTKARDAYLKSYENATVEAAKEKGRADAFARVKKNSQSTLGRLQKVLSGVENASRRPIFPEDEKLRKKPKEKE